jgi:hypothetical protein
MIPSQSVSARPYNVTGSDSSARSDTLGRQAGRSVASAKHGNPEHRVGGDLAFQPGERGA